MLLVSFVVIAASATMRTSTTFDEIIFPAAGARGYETGDFNLLRDHPPIMQYVYGLPLRALSLRYPPEDREWGRYHYAQALLWGSGNSAAQVTFVARLVGVLIGALLVLWVYRVMRPAVGEHGALLGAFLMAFVPDLLAHAGVTYNDVPLALMLFVAVFAIDRAVRTPSASNVALAAAATSIAVGVKTTGLAAFPIMAVLLVMEASAGRFRDSAWRRDVAIAIPLFAAVFYVVMVAIYLGDFSLAGLRHCLAENLRFDGAPRPALLLGEVSRDGFWYFFPVVFFLKTPAALHALLLLAIVAALWAWRGQGRQEMLVHPLRAAAVATVVIVVALMRSHINVGFRHAMPALPFICVLVGAGVWWVWSRSRGPARMAIAALLAANALSALSSYPFFLSYLSEYVRGRPVHTTLVDSNTDWGHGLIALREFMQRRGIAHVYLGYLGSALPEGYGIRYVSLHSFFPLPGNDAGASDRPRHIVVSATFLNGFYSAGETYAALRNRQPIAVVGGSLYVYELE